MGIRAGSVVVDFEGDTSKLEEASEKAQDSVEEFSEKSEKELKKTHKNFSAFSKKIVKSLKTFGIALGAGALVKNVFTLGAALEDTKVAFGTMLGSAEKADEMVRELYDFANETPFYVR